MDIDDISRASATASKLVDDTYTNTAKQFYRPRDERQEVEQFDQHGPAAVAQMIEELGLENYQKYADGIQTLRNKYRR